MYLQRKFSRLLFAVAVTIVMYELFPSKLSRYTSKKFTSTQPIRKKPAYNVIILTYMRSGSSFLGDLIQHHPGVFYVFEPLNTLALQIHGIIGERTIRFLDNTSMNVPLTIEAASPLWVNTMKAIFSCRFEDLNIGTLKQYHMRISESTVETYKCLQKTNITESHWQRLARCLQISNDNCRAATVKVVKTIRMQMEQVEALMKTDPALKIIHLIRDPRGILHSRQQWRYAGETSEPTLACLQILEDLERSKYISSMYPERILTVRYEDVAESPIAAAKQMYSFVGLEMTTEIEQYIWNITYAGLWDGCKFCTVRNNATETANAWRKKLDYQIILKIEKACTNVLNAMGYRLFKSEDGVENFTLSSKHKFYDPDLMKVSV